MGNLSATNSDILRNLKKSVADAILESDKHLQFVTSYLSKGKMVRKTMFSKITWFGIPLN